MDGTIYHEDTKLDVISQQFLMYIHLYGDDHRIVVSDAEASEIGTAHQINHRIREHLLPGRLIESPGYYEMSGAARDARLWRLTDEGRSVIEEYHDVFARPVTREDILDRLAEVEELAQGADNKSKSAKQSVASNRVRLQRAKETMEERIQKMQTVHDGIVSLRHDVNERPTQTDLDAGLHDLEIKLHREIERCDEETNQKLSGRIRKLSARTNNQYLTKLVS